MKRIALLPQPTPRPRPLADLDATGSNGPSHAAGHLRNVYHSFGRF